jgi:hypothetical protein
MITANTETALKPSISGRYVILILLVKENYFIFGIKNLVTIALML